MRRGGVPCVPPAHLSAELQAEPAACTSPTATLPPHPPASTHAASWPTSAPSWPGCTWRSPSAPSRRPFRWGGGLAGGWRWVRARVRVRAQARARALLRGAKARSAALLLLPGQPVSPLPRATASGAPPCPARPPGRCHHGRLQEGAPGLQLPHRLHLHRAAAGGGAHERM